MSACKVGDYEFTVKLTEKTFSAGYDDESAMLEGADHALVKNTKTGESYKFEIGTHENDGAGNFSLDAISSEHATFFSVYHDHETWHQGLEGYFSLPDQSIVDFDSIKDCDFDMLFEIE
jgi:hypothetical protein